MIIENESKLENTSEGISQSRVEDTSNEKLKDQAEFDLYIEDSGDGVYHAHIPLTYISPYTNNPSDQITLALREFKKVIDKKL